VELHRLGALWIDAVRVITMDAAARRVRVEVDYGCLDAGGSTDIGIAVDGHVMLTETVNPTGPVGQLAYEFDLPGAALWSPDAPNLHMLDVRLGQDDMRERFGIRQIAVADQQILINGDAVRLLGFNRHEIHPEFGHGLPDSLLITDLQLLRDMGCNFVRGSHYPQDVRFLDLCDEYGLCVWSESIGWQHTAEHLTDPHYIAAQMTNIDEMVAASFNRPSVIMWGIQNESHSEDPACRPAYEQFIGHLRALDPSRPVTFASNHPFDDVCMDLADIISVNAYPGWYRGELESIPVQLDQIAAHIDAEGHAHKPLIISEIGAGAMYGWRDSHATRWSEQYQNALLEIVIRHLFFNRERYAGLAIWQFGDIRSSQEAGRALGRPGTFNHKGVVDPYRRPKQAYGTVRALFRELSGE
jgi:beta-glucuronidase